MSEAGVNGSAQESATSPETIDQVKELLFGTEQRDLKKRIEELEAELKETRNNFADEIKRVEKQALAQSEKQQRELSAILNSIGALFQDAGKGIVKLSE